ncbi:hypothetical protein [Streptomyces sp. NPDC004721]
MGRQHGHGIRPLAAQGEVRGLCRAGDMHGQQAKDTATAVEPRPTAGLQDLPGRVRVVAHQQGLRVVQAGALGLHNQAAPV